MSNLADAIIEENQIKRAVNTYLHQIFDELQDCSVDDEDGTPLELNNIEGIKQFKTRSEFFEFIRDTADEGLQMIRAEENETE